MLLEAIFGIIAISVVFCCCTFCCYILFQFLLEEDKPDDVQQEPEPWEAKHYYDPLPLSTPSPPDNIFKPTPYTFKLQNGNGIYPAPQPLSMGLPHAVINPAVLQYPPGHVLDQQRKASHHHDPQQHPPGVPPKHYHHPPAQADQHNETKQRNPPPPSSTHPRHRRSRSRSPSPAPRGTKNVWSTNMEFQPPPQNYYQQQYQNQQRQHHPQQTHSDRQYVQLTQEHYPVQPPPKQKHNHHIHFSPEEFLLRESKPHHLQRQYSRQEIEPVERHLPEAQYEAFMASSHATNIIYSQSNNNQYDNDGYSHHHQQQQQHRLIHQEEEEHSNSKHHRHSRSHRSRHKEAVT